MEHETSIELVPQGLQLPSSPVRKKLYTSHFLSTWNARVFEFGAVLFISSIYPNTLLPASVYALSRSAAAVVFSSAVGSFIDHGNRMHVVRVSIRKCGHASNPFVLKIDVHQWDRGLQQLCHASYY